MMASDGDDADYARTYDIDTASIEPQVAFPHLPENTKGISEVGDIKIDQAVVGAVILQVGVQQIHWLAAHVDAPDLEGHGVQADFHVADEAFAERTNHL